MLFRSNARLSVSTWMCTCWSNIPRTSRQHLPLTIRCFNSVTLSWTQFSKAFFEPLRHLKLTVQPQSPGFLRLTILVFLRKEGITSIDIGLTVWITQEPTASPAHVLYDLVNQRFDLHLVDASRVLCDEATVRGKCLQAGFNSVQVIFRS